MSDVDKKEVIDTQQATPQPKAKEKNKTFLYVGIVVLFAIASILIFLTIKKFEDIPQVVEIEEVLEEYGVLKEEGNDEAKITEESTQGSIDGTLEEANIITEKFPKDIPLPGGIVVSSSYGGNLVEVRIETNSSVEEVVNWYSNALKKEDWEITAKTSEEPKEGATKTIIKFTKTVEEKERKGEVLIETNPQIQVTAITVREILN